MRLFLGLPIPQPTREALSEALACDGLAAALPGPIAVPSNWHVTLSFLGQVPPERAEVLREALLDLPLGASFTLRLTRLGCFDRPQRARVLFVAIDGDMERLFQLQKQLEAMTIGLGFRPENRTYHPHLTLMRPKPPRDLTALLDSSPDFGLPLPVDRVALFESRSSARGTEYVELMAAPLS